MFKPHFIAALLAFLAEGPHTFAQNFEEAHHQATDVVSGTLFLFNPAVPQARQDRASLGLVLPRVPDRKGQILAAGVSASGSDQSSYGLRAEITDYEPAEDDDAPDSSEKFSGRYLAGHYGMQIAGMLRLGLIAQLYQVEGGTVAFGDGVRSNAEGLLIGVGAGLFLGSEKGGFGIAYYPGMRGAAEAEGEHRILGRAQQVVIEGAFPISQKTTLGLSFRTAEAPEGIDADVGTLDTPTGSRPAGTLSAGYATKHENRWLHRFTVQREGYGAGQDADPDQKLEEGTESLWATRLKFLFGREGPAATQSYVGATAWLRDRAVEDEEGTNLPGDYSFSQISYLAMLSFPL